MISSAKRSDFSAGVRLFAPWSRQNPAPSLHLHAILHPEFARVYGIVKRAEYDEFLQVISPWEREHLLLNV